MEAESNSFEMRQDMQAQLNLYQCEVKELRNAVAIAREQATAAQQRVRELETANEVSQLRLPLHPTGNSTDHFPSEYRLLEVSAKAAKALLTITHFDEAVNTALQIIGEALETGRVGVMENFDHPSDSSFPHWRMLYEWNSSHTIPQSFHPMVGEGSYAEIEWLYELFQQGQSTSYQIEDAPEPFRNGQIAIEVKATHLVPIFVDGQWWGVLGLDDCREAKPRSAAELSVLKIAADCVGSAIQRERIQQALLQAEQARSQELERLNIQLEQTLERLAGSEAHYRALFELSSEGIYRWELDQPICLTLPVAEQIDQVRCHLYVAEANATYAAMYGLATPEAAVGLRLGDAHISTSSKNLEFLSRWIENGYRIRTAESEEVNCEGKQCYFLNNVIGIVEDDQLIGGWGTQLDITELRETQQTLLQAEQARAAELAKVNEELQQRDRLLSVVAQVTKDLLEAEDVDLAIPAALQAVGEAANMSRVLLHFERFDPTTQRFMPLRCL